MIMSGNLRVRKLFLDCSFIYTSDLRTGIQRVVSNILDFSEEVGRELGVHCQPVVWDSGEFRPVSWPPPKIAAKRKPSKVFLIRRLTRRVLELVLPGSLYLLLRYFYLNLKKMKYYWVGSGLHAPPIEFAKGDTLVLLDSSWHIPFWQSVRKMRKAGVRVGIVIYDLIPIRMPQFCDLTLVDIFNTWIREASTAIDFYLAISKSARLDFESYLREREIKKQPKSLAFRLGADLARFKVKKGKIRQALRRLFAGDQRPYIIVGTLEPRKNHRYLLDAFEMLWRQGLEANLCVIGKKGWLIEDTLKRIYTHEEWRKKLFMFNNLSDSELAFAYKKAKALVLPSIVEGFGLPIVEALRNRLPVFASDIPVFREVGGDFGAYFSLNSPASLARLVSNFEKTGRYPAKRSLNEFSWPTWRESTKEFLEKVLLLAHDEAKG